MVATVRNGAIEMFGLCGAGKSTLARGCLLVGESGQVGARLRPERPVKPSGWVTVAMAGLIAVSHGLRDPGGCARLLSSGAGRWLFLKLGYRVAGLHMRQDLDGCLLLDSGVLQPLVSFEVEYNLQLIEWNVERLARALPLPLYALYVRVEPEIAMQRYMDRERRQGRSVLMERIEDRFVRGFKTAERLHEICVALGICCIICDNTRLVSQKELSGIVTTLLCEGAGR